MSRQRNEPTGDHAHHHGHAHGGHSHGSPGHGVGTERGFVSAPRPPGAQTRKLERGAGRGRTLFLDLPSGIAGDMTVAGLVDLGVPLEVMRGAVTALGLEGVEISVRTGYAGAIGCTHFDVSWPEQAGERSYAQIERLISTSSLDEGVKSLAQRIFLRLAKAEARVHQTTLDQVHFHEVGAIDAIVDIVGASAGFDYLGARVKASPVPLGRGFVQCRHGTLPLPAPATLNCLEGVPTIASGLEAELVTPTGAAIIATVAEEFGAWFPLSPEHVGWGAGTRGLPDRPNALRMILGVEKSQSLRSSHVLLEANVDDMTGEIAAHALSRVLAAGALDVWIVPATMKKNRPGLVFSALATEEARTRVTDAMLRETTTIGVRQSPVSRVELVRELRQISTRWGTVRVKTSGAGTEAFKEKPEIDDCAAIATREGIPLRMVLDEVHRLLVSTESAES